MIEVYYKNNDVKNYKSIHEIETSDNLTENQMHAFVKEHFEKVS